MKFRKKPVVIDATHWDGTYLAAKQIETTLGLNTLSMTSHPPSNSISYWRIGTLEGGHEVSPLDWIITGVKGEHYPCKPDIFELTYEPVEEAALAQPEQQSVYCLNCEELRKQVTALKICLEVERGFREQEQPAQQEPVDFASLLREAEEIVRAKPTWKRFIDGTPLSNDIAIWMTVFAQDFARRTSPQPAQQDIPDLIAGTLGVSRGTAYDMMREALAEQPAQQEPVAWEQFYPDIGKPQIEQPKVRTGDCLLVGVCASEGHKIQKAQPEQKPVEWGVDWGKDGNSVSIIKRLADGNIEVLAWEYAPHPPHRTWVGLTDEEAFQICVDCGCLSEEWLTLLDAIEDKLKEKNT